MIKEHQKLTIEHYQYVPDISRLGLIKDENVNIAIYERPKVYRLSDFIKQLINTNFSALNISMDITDFDTLFDDHFRIYQPISPSGYQLLKSDIKRLVTLFAEICDASTIKVFFGRIDTDMCKRFHVDMYELRMLCTYSGEGTLWLTDDNINYKALNSYGQNEEIVLRENDVRRLKPRDVAIIKGALYPDSKIGGLVHKSPAIEKLNKKRILLRVDNNSLSSII